MMADHPHNDRITLIINYGKHNRKKYCDHAVLPRNLHYQTCFIPHIARDFISHIHARNILL